MNPAPPTDAVLTGATDIQAVVVTYNSAKDLGPLIESGVMERTFAEIVVVDNASTDDSANMARAAGWRVIAMTENIGFAAASNVGVAATTSPLFVIMNPDIDVRAPENVVTLVRHFDDPEVGLVAPRLRLPSNQIQDSARRVPAPFTLARRRLLGHDHDRIDSQDPIDVPWVVGAFLLVRRTAHEDIGGMDIRYPLYFEDVDYCVRLWNSGWRVRYDGSVEIDHLHNAASRKLFSQASRWHMRSAVRFYLRHPGHFFLSEPRPRYRGFSQRTVHLAASPGGHIHLLRSMGPAFADLDRTWITAAGSHSDDLRASGERVLTVGRVRGVSRGRALVNAARSALLAFRERPRLIVTSGADMVIPFVLVARFLGARLYYVESITRVTTESRSGRLVARWCVKHYVQWPELQVRPNVSLVWPESFSELPGELPARRGAGTLVTVGNHTAPFDRLTDAACRAAEAGLLPSPVVVQYGYSAKPSSRAVTALQWLPAERMRELTATADVIITHAGSGSVLGALTSGLRPIVMARSAARGEHVDDHQAELVAKLGQLGLLVAAEDAIDASTVQRTFEPVQVPVRPGHVPTLDAALGKELARYTPEA